MPLFPANNWWNTDVSNAPVDPNSSTLIANVGSLNVPNPPVHPDWGGDVGGGFIYGFPFIQVDGSQAKKTVTFDTPEESDGVNHSTQTSIPFYPIPAEAETLNGWVEDGPPGNVDERADNDRHMLIVDTTNNTLYELYNVFYDGANWFAGSGAFFDMKTNNRRPDTWTSADAAGLAMLPGLVRYDEVYGPDEINHAFRLTVSATDNYFVFPASHHSFASHPGFLPMGGRLRLKASTNISSLAPAVQKICQALKKYGLIVADNGSSMYISGAYDIRWDMDVMLTLNALHASDFEVVQLGWKPSGSFVISTPATLGAGTPASMTVTVYDGNYNVATTYTGTIHFSSTDGAAGLPANYTFTGADAGVHTFSLTMRTTGSQSVTATSTADATITGLRTVTVVPGTPATLTASAITGTRIDLSWSASLGATHYEILRASGGALTTLTTTSDSSTTFPDTTVVAGTSYIYKVRGLDAAARQSGLSNPDAATTIFFVDDPFASGTIIQSVHLDQLRQAITALRTAAGLMTSPFTDPALSNSVFVKAAHIQELRTALDGARAAIGLVPLSYTDSTLTQSSTTIKAVHFQELRNGVK